MFSSSTPSGLSTGKLIMYMVGGIIIIAFLWRLVWAYQQVKNDEAKANYTPAIVTKTMPEIIQVNATATTPVVLSATDLKAKEDLKNTISGLTKSIKLKCGAGSADTQCGVAKKIVDALTNECLPLVKEKEISDCIFRFGAGAVFSPTNTTTSSVNAVVTVSFLSTISKDVEGATNLNVKTGDSVYSHWSSTNANEASLGAALTKCTDSSLNEVLPTKQVPPESYQYDGVIPASYAGCTMTMKITVKDTTSGQQATATNIITVK